MLKVAWTGLDSVSGKLHGTIAKVNASCAAVVRSEAEAVAAAAVVALAPRATAATRRLGGGRSRPAGMLAKSVEIVSSVAGRVARVRFTAPHAHLIEWGTVKARPFPYLLVALESRRRRIEARIAEAVKYATGQ